METDEIVIVGAGAAGMFAAAAIAELAPRQSVRVLEKGRRPLMKVARTGGGRCNLTHAAADLRELAGHYPRGAAELLGPLHRFGPAETMAWFEAHGVPVIVEEDGRVFPRSQKAEDVVCALLETAGRGQVTLQCGVTVRSIRLRAAGFDVVADDRVVRARRVLIATGGGSFPSGLSHTIEPFVPSLFALRLERADPTLAGVSVRRARVSSAGCEAAGPVLFTHTGLSGPAVLDLSAWAARKFAESNYRGELTVDWLPEAGVEETIAALEDMRRTAGRRQIGSQAMGGLPLRLWRALLARAGISAARRWAEASREEFRRLHAELRRGVYTVCGMARHSGEFVTCGGVRRSEVDFRTMASRRHPGLFLAGETLDVDGLTGGYNLQAAWTTGRIAAESLLDC